MNYVTSEVDIIDFNEKDISVKDWIYSHYNIADVYYMVSNELFINFINSNNK